MSWSLLGRTRPQRLICRRLTATAYRPHTLRHSSNHAHSPTASHEEDPLAVDHNPSTPRHLLRSLLRECTYLPDPQSRQWLATHILQRYRRSVSTRTSSRDPTTRISAKNPPPPQWDSTRQRTTTAEARKALGQLQRANTGDLKLMLKVLAMTYGRTGRRRHELLNPLLQHPSDHKPTTVEQSPNASKTPTQTLPLLKPAFHALLLSQSQTSLPTLFRPTLRNINPQFPTTNVWNRPMPLKRLRNLEKTWYAHTLERVHPPLPTKEWERLRDLASGSGRVDPVQPPRRKVIEDMGVDGAKDFSALEAVVLKGKPRLERLGIEKSNQAGSIGGRSMRRLWRAVFAVCPRLDYDGGEGKWVVQWGGREVARMEREGRATERKRYGRAARESVDENGDMDSVAFASAVMVSSHRDEVGSGDGGGTDANSRIKGSKDGYDEDTEGGAQNSGDEGEDVWDEHVDVDDWTSTQSR